MTAPTTTRDPPGPPQPRITLAHRMPPASGEYRWVYLWGWPIRAMHWAAVASLVVLVITGLYIGNPWLQTTGEASSHFLMGWFRFMHFLAAAVLVATGIVRFYWLFAGNRFERWRALFPVRPRDWVNMFKQVKFYLMIRPEKAPRYLGHNPLQQLSYTAIYLSAVLIVITGFAMYGQSNPGGLWYTLFNWVGRAMGGMQVVRLLHHALTWVFVIFVPIHVYLAIRADHMERTGTISSIISGGRFIPADERFEDGGPDA